MSIARRNAFDAFRVIESLLDEPLFVDNSLLATPHNERAQLLRNGLAISLFCAVESFLKDRFAEILPIMAHSRISYADFDDKTKEIFTTKAIAGVHGYLKRIQGSTDKITFIETAISDLHGVNTNPPTFPHYGFGFERSNLNEGDLDTILRGLILREPWTLIKNISDRCNMGILDPRSGFTKLAKLRHSAAHNLAANTTTSDLIDGVFTAKCIAMSFDIIATHAALAFSRYSRFSDVKQALQSSGFKLRFLDEAQSDEWKEKKETASRYAKKHPSLDRGRHLALINAQRNAEVLVIRSLNQRPREWHL
jgi:hypothetical protein